MAAAAAAAADLQDMYSEPKPMSAHEKAAILFIALGGDYAAKVFAHMDEEEIEAITLDIANNKQVSIEKKNMVISEFYQLMMANDYVSTGGLEYAQSVLEKALGAERLPTSSNASRRACRCVRSSSCAKQTRHSF